VAVLKLSVGLGVVLLPVITAPKFGVLLSRANVVTPSKTKLGATGPVAGLKVRMRPVANPESGTDGRVVPRLVGVAERVAVWLKV
jgi:hypothetical protein